MNRLLAWGALEQTVGNRQNLPPGTLLDGSYKIVCVVGAGGFGVTYEAEDVNLGTAVAIKEYFPEEFATRTQNAQVRPTSDRHATTFAWGRSGFLQEARTLAKFRHPSVVRVFRIFEANATAYMVMEFEKGPSFEKWLRSLGRPPSQDELDHLITPLLDALEIMHRESFLHRDIAPDNIIIRSDITPVLLDFGAARKTIAAKTHAMTGMIKQGYSPQEQYSADGKHQGPWSDFYALGATLYRAVTGQPPEEAPSRGLYDTMIPAVEAAKGNYRASFLKGIDACLKVRPADRPQTVFQVRELLDAGGARPKTTKMETANGAATAPAGTTTTTYIGRGQPNSSKRHVIIGTAAAVSVMVAVVGGYAYTLWQAERLTRAVEQKAQIDRDNEARRRADEQRRMEAEKTRMADQTEQERQMRKADAERLKREQVRLDPIATLSPGSGASVRDNLTNGDPCPFCPEMVVVPAGRFTMGSPTNEPQRGIDEDQVSVTIPRPFAVAKFAVTFDEWDSCVADGGCNGDRAIDRGWGRGRRPVINISWNDAKAYVGWLSEKTGKTYRLPSEAEREYFARAGTITPFWWGSSITPSQANYDGNIYYDGGGELGEYRKQTLQIDSFQANPWGLYQVHGNVWEWVEDCWNDKNSGNPGNGTARLTGDCGRRVLRGGSWSYNPRYLRSADRNKYSPDYWNSSFGFRVARTLDP